MKVNTPKKYPAPKTHEGATAVRINATQELRRTVMACMLWEDTFYEDGQDVATRIKEGVAKLVKDGKADDVKRIAVEARTEMYLRHVPLLVVSELAHNRVNVADVLYNVVQRADELAEFLAIYWKDGRCKLSASVKRGLARAFTKFSAYSLAKYNKDGEIKLKDVMFLTHPKPQSIVQGEAWKKLVEGKLEAPDTWEVQLSAGKDKREVFERLIREEKLGGLALLRNLRNMNEAGVSDELINARLELGAERALPFRYLQAATVAPRFEQAIEKGMFRQLEQVPKLKGHTLLVVDTSGSMGAMLSGKSEVTRRDAAVSVAMIAKEMCERATIYATAGNDGSRKHATAKLPSRRGFAMARSFVSDVDKLGYGGIFLTQCMEAIEKESGEVFDRVIVFTDEQDCDIARKPENAKLLGKRNYLVNVGTYKNGIGYGKWLHIDGWSERVLEYIRVFESEGGNE